ncbi:MAG TPA: M48 family metalloprotease, partial [Actinomycetota bacterium]|nr:M48 family metalloprotease [Actinomycetota bacterium]
MENKLASPLGSPNLSSQESLSLEALRRCLHPSESTLARLALVGIAPVAIAALFLTVATLGTLPIAVVVGLWFTGRIVEARLKGGAVVVNAHNFPEIAAQIERIRERLGYPKPVRAFVTQDGEINAFLWRTFGRRYMSFNSGLVEDLTYQEREFIIGRFVGALRARHLRFHEAASFIEGFERFVGFNLLVLPYLRISVFSGD